MLVQWMPDTASKFMRRVEVTPFCWEWRGAFSSGNPRFTVKSACGFVASYPVGAHRAALMLVGVDPEEKDVYRHCRNRSCVNPNHLEVLASHHRGRVARRAQAWGPGDWVPFERDLSVLLAEMSDRQRSEWRVSR